MRDIKKRSFVSYKDALKREKELGRIITLFDEKLVKIKERKDGKFTIEPILRLYGTDKNPSSYDNTLITQKGFLALEIEEREKRIFCENEIIDFEKQKDDKFNVYRCIKNRKKEYALLDYNLDTESFGHNLQIVQLVPNFDEKNTYKLTLVETKNKDRLSLENEYLKQRSLDGHFYYYLKDLNVSEEIKKHITYIERTEENTFTISNHTYYLMPFININGMSPSLQKEYWLLAKDATKVGINFNDENDIRIEMYGQISNKQYNEGAYKFFFLLSPYSVLKGIPKKIEEIIIKLEKNNGKFELVQTKKNSKIYTKK